MYRFALQTFIYSYIRLSQDIKANRELRREAPQLSIGFDFCPNITDYSYNIYLII
ncbi:hypothetical protein FEV09_17865 [Pseudanabaena catenata USMAC16]|uniref:Uncharacterized protein n=1 Tax=Pseudanabaena catenata USMAC16 TaxID=1855837 RepID=A0A9X4RIT8_9CYAN|nr:hypothetical protein [Pseudanabaena catenata]MDG3496408.1 hypothetical protein [Pseudanabaena catenata USMAC16]